MGELLHGQVLKFRSWAKGLFKPCLTHLGATPSPIFFDFPLEIHAVRPFSRLPTAPRGLREPLRGASEGGARGRPGAGLGRAAAQAGSDE